MRRRSLFKYTTGDGSDLNIVSGCIGPPGAPCLAILMSRAIPHLTREVYWLLQYYYYQALSSKIEQDLVGVHSGRKFNNNQLQQRGKLWLSGWSARFIEANCCWGLLSQLGHYSNSPVQWLSFKYGKKGMVSIVCLPIPCFSQFIQVIYFVKHILQRETVIFPPRPIDDGVSLRWQIVWYGPSYRLCA